ncbi:hypothetical protein D3C81_2009280 [compost metagenome]
MDAFAKLPIGSKLNVTVPAETLRTGLTVLVEGTIEKAEFVFAVAVFNGSVIQSPLTINLYS